MNILDFVYYLRFEGIGEQTAYSIASRGAKVILACRNVKKGNIVKGKDNFLVISMTN